MQISTKKDALKRLAIAQGHLERVRKMLEEDIYCPDVIHQSRSVQAALRKVDEVILEGHLYSCVLGNIGKPGVNKKKLVSEVVDVFRKQEA